MNLIKSFNINYLKQNIKKSKGLLGIFLILVPLANFLQIFLMSINSEKAIILETEKFMIFNIIGMYIIPIIISVALSGYVFKKKSVDFINSMPINKETIFTTNTIGGIVLILGMQLINLIVMLIGKLIFQNIVIYPQMMLEIFMQMTISYIFVYTIANIAMSISGNVITQIIVTALIIFTVPFVIHASNDFTLKQDVRIISNYGTIDGVTQKDMEFTLPYGIIAKIMSDNLNLINYKIMLRTLMLSVIYFFIGKYLFKKRKMENAEESFADSKKHLIIKILTLLPIAFLYDFIRETLISLSGKIIIITLTIIYWFIYDLITKKKIKFKYSILYLVVGTVILEALVHTTHQAISSKKDELQIINGNEISGFSIDGEYYTEDEEILKDLCKSNANYSKRRTIYIKLKNGETLSQLIYPTDNYLKLQKETMKKEIESVDKIIVGKTEVKGKEKQEIIDELEKYIQNAEIGQFSNPSYKEEVFYLVNYKNCQISKIDKSIELNDEIFKKTTKILNRNTKKYIEDMKNSNKNINNYIYCRLIDEKGKNNYKSDAIELKDLEKYVNEHYEEECSMEKPYYIMSEGEIKFYTNNIKDVEKLLE